MPLSMPVLAYPKIGYTIKSSKKTYSAVLQAAMAVVATSAGIAIAAMGGAAVVASAIAAAISAVVGICTIQSVMMQMMMMQMMMQKANRDAVYAVLVKLV